MKQKPVDGMMSTVSQGIIPALNVDTAESGMVPSFQTQFSKGDSKDIWGGQEWWRGSSWKTTSEEWRTETPHCSWSTHRCLDIYTASSDTTHSGSSNCPFLLYALLNADPNVISSPSMPFKSSFSFSRSQGTVKYRYTYSYSFLAQGA